MSSNKEKSKSNTTIPISHHETSQIATSEPQIPPSSSKSKFSFLFTKDLPATLSFFMYTTLTLIYTPITIYKNGIHAYLRMLKNRGWKYFLLSFVDVEANYFGIKAYAYTSILSTILLDAWAIPVCVILSIFLLHVKYHWSQYLGVAICMAGIGVLIEGDFQSGKDIYYAVDPIKGDILCLISATFFGISNVVEEYYVRKRPAYEVLGQMGLWGMIISGIHVAILERSDLMHVLYPLAAVCTILGLLVFYVYPATQPTIESEGDSIEQVVSDEETSNKYVRT
ncbi:29067_t:CDS:2, partial [Gigaspora margarita]